MNNWDIRKQIIALALLPLLIVATVLTGYFTLSQLNFISESAMRQGTIVTNQLASVSEYAVFSGNIDSLIPIFQNILAAEDVIEIKLTDAGNELLHRSMITITRNQKNLYGTNWHLKNSLFLGSRSKLRR